jgi:hypothetical protein
MRDPTAIGVYEVAPQNLYHFGVHRYRVPYQGKDSCIGSSDGGMGTSSPLIVVTSNCCGTSESCQAQPKSRDRGLTPLSGRREPP